MTNPTDPFDCEGEWSVKALLRILPRLEQAHFTNIRIRINGKWEEHQGDFIKHLLPAMRRAVVKWMRKKAYDMVEGEKPPVVRGRGLSARNQASVCYQLADQLERGKK